MIVALAQGAVTTAARADAAFSRPQLVQTRPPQAPTAPVTILTRAGEQHLFTAEVVSTPETRARGLMFRDRLAPSAGMLFVYPEPAQTAFWMRNTYIPLDIIFAGADGVILNIARGRPLDETPLPSAGRAQFVLEIPAGRAAALGVAAGDRMISPAMLDAARIAQ